MHERTDLVELLLHGYSGALMLLGIFRSYRRERTLQNCAYECGCVGVGAWVCVRRGKGGGVEKRASDIIDRYKLARNLLATIV